MSVAATQAAPPEVDPVEELPQKTDTELAHECKSEGNAAFRQKNYQGALKAYDQALGHAIRSNPPDVNLQGSLWNNKAMALLKMERFSEAEICCTRVLDYLKQPLPKAYHRRAGAREVMARDETLSLERRRELLENAGADLQAALAELERDQQMPSEEKNKQRREVAEALEKIRFSLGRINRSPMQSNKQASGLTRVAATANEDTPASPAFTPDVKPRHHRRTVTPTIAVDGSLVSVSPFQQRHNVWRLLLSRQTQLPAKTVEGEAFYVVEWCWWCDFCRHVDLFHKREGSKEKRGLILRAMPPGSTVPGEEPGDEDDDFTGPPGPIDNAALILFPPNAGNDGTHQKGYYRQWHRLSDQQDIQLVPNLVRGYDYEIIPREVYHALREWYGEVTPSICRRAVVTGDTLCVALYPQTLGPIPPVLEWNTEVYDRCGTCRRPGVRLRCRRCLNIYYCNRDCQQIHWPLHKQHCQPVSAEGASGGVAHSEGRVGLISLGNTCFMNAALQCLSHTAPLTRHFLSGKYTIDLNRTNPLGTGGKLAEAYSSVLQELWMRPGAKHVKPFALKRAIATFAPRFAGTLQHDSQEFLAYLLDGLHEDLNRVRKAPYVELPDFQDGQNMRVAGARAWEAHMRRNDSLVLDTFYGQFKSTCVCPRCQRVSVSFDAFNHVSLEIPQNQPIVPIVVTVVRAAGEFGFPIPERYAIPFKKSNPLREFKRELSKLCGVPAEKLHLCEVRESEIVNCLKDHETAVGILPTDLLVAYEADPFEKLCFHAIVCNKTDNSTEESFFGLPLLTSFPIDSTCRDVWNHFVPMAEDKLKNPAEIDGVVRIVIHDKRNRPLEVFPTVSGGEDDFSENSKTGVLPKNLDEPISNYLGPRAHEAFLLMFVEWSGMDDPSQKEDEKENTSQVNVERFCVFRDHPSYTNSLEEIRREAVTKRGVSLDDCFRAFIQPERLDEHNMWYCSNCTDHVRAMKTMELWRLPDVLVVHLKRFEFRNVLRREKLETFVDYPVEGLDMSKHCGPIQENGFVDEQIPAVYDLFGVVQHFGRAGFGKCLWCDFGSAQQQVLSLMALMLFSLVHK